LVDEAATSATLACFDQVCGLAALAVLHLNDAACERGSRKDRHAHIGHGQIPLAGFRALVNHPRMSAIPKIIETPKESTENGEHWDAINLRTLRSLVGPQLT
jgi:deoxyribonuclease-4